MICGNSDGVSRTTPRPFVTTPSDTPATNAAGPQLATRVRQGLAKGFRETGPGAFAGQNPPLFGACFTGHPLRKNEIPWPFLGITPCVRTPKDQFTASGTPKVQKN